MEIMCDWLLAQHKWHHLDRGREIERDRQRDGRRRRERRGKIDRERWRGKRERGERVR